MERDTYSKTNFKDIQEIDIALLLQEEATQNQYIFNFVLMNLIFVVAYFNRNKRIPEYFTWFLILIFLLYAYWDTDYFSFRHSFHTSLEGHRDPLYYYIGLLSFNSYTIFRFYTLNCRTKYIFLLIVHNFHH